MNSLNVKNIGRSIRKHRLDLDLTQSELAEKVDISPSAIGMYEQGRRTPPVDVLYNISVALNVNFIDLVPEVRIQSLKVDNEDQEILKIINFIKKEKHQQKADTLMQKENKGIINTITAHLNSDKLSKRDLNDIERFVKFVKSEKKSK